MVSMTGMRISKMKCKWLLAGFGSSVLAICVGGCDIGAVRQEANSATPAVAQVSPDRPRDSRAGVRFVAEPTEAPELFSRGSYIDRKNAWVADGFALKRTTDGGQTWQLMRPAPEDEAEFGKMGGIYVFPNFISPTHGWLSGIKGLWRTEDGGSTWRQVFKENPDVPAFADEQHGWTATYSETEQLRYVTKDGGRTWEKCGSSRLVNENVPSSIFFLTPEAGWSITSRTNDDGQKIYGVAQTRDGGCSWKQSWSSVADPDRKYCGIYFLNRNEGWLAGCYTTGNLLQTKDGGKTWHQVQTPTEAWRSTPIDVYFIDAQRGWILTRATQANNPEGLYRTLDGGKTWQEISGTELTSDFAKDDEHNSIPSKWKGGRLYQLIYAGKATNR